MILSKTTKQGETHVWWETKGEVKIDTECFDTLMFYFPVRSLQTQLLPSILFYLNQEKVQ